jgi:hypothetical protein
MRDVTAVNDEFEVGYDAEFEEGWHRVVLGGRVVMVLFVLAALAGLMGRGPFSHHTVSSPSGALSVDLEPVARYGTPTQVTIHVRPPAGAHTVQIGLSTSVLEPLGLHAILPQPDPEQPGERGGLLINVPIPPNETEALIRLQEDPTVIGPVPITIRFVGGETLRTTQFIMP